MHYYTQILFIILICFLSPLLPPHMFPSLWTFLFTFSCSPFRVFCLKKKNKPKTEKKRRKKDSAERLKLYFVYLQAVCLLSRYVAILSQWDRVNFCSESPKLLELGKAVSPLSQRWSLAKALPAGKVSEAKAHINTLVGNCKGLLKERLTEICFSSSRPKLQQKGGQERVYPSLGCGAYSSSWLSLWPPGI